MIDIIELKAIAKSEYAKKEGNYATKYNILSAKHQELDRKLKRNETVSPELLVSTKMMLDEVSSEMNKVLMLRIFEVNKMASQILINNEYNNILKDNVNKIGNYNLKSPWVEELQESGLLNDLWDQISKREEITISNQIIILTTVVDALADYVVLSKGTNIPNLCELNNECNENGISLALSLYDKIETNGKRKVNELLNNLLTNEDITLFEKASLIGSVRQKETILPKSFKIITK